MARSRKRALGRNDPVFEEEDPTINLTALKELIDETTASIQLLAQPNQPLTREVCDLLASASGQMWRYSQLLSLGKETAAQYALTSIGQNLLKAAAISTEHLSQLDAKAEAYATAESALQNVVVDDKLGGEMAMNLSLAVSQSVVIYKELIQLDQTVESLRKEVARASSDWLLDDDAPEVQPHLRWLGGERTGFTTLASHYLLSRDRYDDEALEKLRDEAEDHLNQLEEVIQTAKRLHTGTLQKAQEILGGKQERYAELVRELQKQRDTLQSQSPELTSTLIRSVLIDSELADWAAYEAMPKFQNLDRARYDLGSVIARIWRRLDSRPQLSSNARLIIEEARKYTDDLFDELEERNVASEPQPEPAQITKPQPVIPKVATPSPSRSLSQEAAAQPGIAVVTERVDEIYEMILAVAAYRYCGERFLQGMTINSVLGILLFMKRISDEEFKTYANAITQKVTSRSKSIDDTKKVTDAWKTTSPTVLDWIDYPNGRGGRFFKLVLQGKEPALYFASQFGITDKATMIAKDQYNKAKTRLRNA